MMIMHLLVVVLLPDAANITPIPDEEGARRPGQSEKQRW